MRMQTPETLESLSSAIVIAGRTLRTSVPAAFEPHHTASDLPFAVLPNGDDREGRVALEIAKTLHECGVRVFLLLSWELLQAEGPVLPPGSYQPFFTEEGLEELFTAALRRDKPDLLFLGVTTVRYQVLPRSGRSGGFSVEVESTRTLERSVREHKGDDCVVVHCSARETDRARSVSDVALEHVLRGCSEFRSLHEGKVFAQSGVKSSFDTAGPEPVLAVRKH